ncbi:MAG: peptidoglycan editing factor PgeF [Elainellaceae cyanobacterium]
MSGWHWQTWQGRPYLTCDLLSPWGHGFFTRHWSPAPPSVINQALAPEASVYQVKQVHGDRVLGAHHLTPTAELERSLDQSPPPADGIVAQSPQQSIWVATADCVPVLIGDRRLGSVAAVHAGWRGTAQRIVPIAVSQLRQQGSQLQDLRIALGPAIAGSVYQVSTAVAARVGATLVPAPADIAAVSVAPPSSQSELTEPAPDTAIQAVLDQLSHIVQSPVAPDPQPNRVRLDVRRVNQLQLEQLGIATEQIAVAPHCTYRDGDRFFSYRREALKKIQWSGIVS